MKNMTSRIKQHNGFTLAETLMAVLILSMVTGIVAVGVPAATSAYKNAVDASHAQVLLSTTMTALRNELSTAKDVSATGTIISYIDEDDRRSEITVEDDGIYLTKAKGIIEEDEPLVASGSGANAISRLLVSKEAATSNMYAQYTGSSFADNIIKITGLSVMRGTGTISDLGLVYEIRVVG